MRRLPILLAVLVVSASSGTASASLPSCDGLTATLQGTSGPDLLVGTPGPDVIAGLSGDDVVRGRGGDDVICAGPGDDVVNGGAGDDRIFGGEGSDRLNPGAGADLIEGGPGVDLSGFARSPAGVIADLGAGTALGWGRDLLRDVEGVIGSVHADLLLGTDADDELYGGPGTDRIEAGPGADRARGGPGDDVVIGGPGKDDVRGGSGRDSCDTAGARGCESANLPAVRFVAPLGDDEDDGLTPSTAWRSVAAALHAADPGSTVWLLPGRYAQQVSIGGIGVGGALPILVSGVGRPVLDGEGTRALGLFCDSCAGLVVQGLEVRGYTDIGIGATLSRDVVVRDVHVHGNGFAVRLVGWEIEGYGIHVDSSSNVVIEDADVHDNGPDPPRPPDRILGTGINTYELVGATIRNNRSYRNHGGGILVEDSVGVLVDGNEVFENELDASVDSWWDAGLWVDGGRDVVISGNTFWGNLGPGIQLSDEDRQDPTGYVLRDNTSTGNYWGLHVWNFGTDGWPDAVILEGVNDFAGNRCGDLWFSPGSDFRTCP